MQPQHSLVNISNTPTKPPKASDGAVTRLNQSVNGADQNEDFAAILAGTIVPLDKPESHADSPSDTVTAQPETEADLEADVQHKPIETSDTAAALPAVEKEISTELEGTHTQKANVAASRADNADLDATVAATSSDNRSGQDAYKISASMDVPQDLGLRPNAEDPVGSGKASPGPQQAAAQATQKTGALSPYIVLAQVSGTDAPTAERKSASAAPNFDPNAVSIAPNHKTPDSTESIKSAGIPVSTAGIPGTAFRQMQQNKSLQDGHNEPLPSALPETTTARPLPNAVHLSAGMAVQRAPIDHTSPRRAARIDESRRNVPAQDAFQFVPSRVPTLPIKQVVPLTKWHANSAIFAQEPATKELLSIDPITSEPRLSSLATGTNVTATTARPELPVLIARQLAEVVQQNPNRAIEITLKPQELGTVRLSLQQAETGIVVSLVAERPETLDLMRRNIDQLGAEFKELGYTDIAFSFAGTDADADADLYQQSDDTSSRGSAETEDPVAAPRPPSIHLTSTISNGVDLRL